MNSLIKNPLKIFTYCFVILAGMSFSLNSFGQSTEVNPSPSTKPSSSGKSKQKPMPTGEDPTQIGEGLSSLYQPVQDTTKDNEGPFKDNAESQIGGEAILPKNL